MTTLNYANDMAIDPDALDVECLEQAALAIKYAQNFLIKKKIFMQATETVKIVKAELMAEANDKLDKPTVGNIEMYYRTHKKHKEAKKEWIEAQLEMDSAEIAKNEVAFTRKTMLENLITLHGQQYFAGPRVPRNLSQEYEKRKEKTNSVQTRLTMRRGK